ncbi:MAG: hypothetical protein GF401_00985 [Chitinivibrionales bacterium]|nr:hypothetical protein [Chitinivibrionales bacterium]
MPDDHTDGDHTYPVTTDIDSKPTYTRGIKRPWWMIISIPFIILIVFMRKHVKNMCWKSSLCLVALFEFTLLFVEHNSVMIGHWVYNKNAILGFEIWSIPIEEPLIYYLFPPIFVVMIFHLFLTRFAKEKDDDR